MTFNKVFSDSFDTYKVFNNINLIKASCTSVNTSKTVWQILNHLIMWQEFQLSKLKGIDTPDINESDTWINEAEITDQELLLETIKVFENHIVQIKAEIARLTIECPNLDGKLKIIQDLSIHLSFHLGEMILLMRQNGHYPMPGEMKVFLADS